LKKVNGYFLHKTELKTYTLKEEVFVKEGFAVFAQIRKSFFRKKSIIGQSQKLFPQNLRCFFFYLNYTVKVSQKFCSKNLSFFVVYQHPKHFFIFDGIIQARVKDFI